MISTHVLDTRAGAPAVGVRIELYRGDELLASRETDSDGRVRDLADVEPGVYRLVFHPPSPFFRRIEVELELGEPLDEARAALEEPGELVDGQLPR